MKLREIARLLGGELHGGDPEEDIAGVSGIGEAAAGDITFVVGSRQEKRARESAASCFLVREVLPGLRGAQVKVDDPHYAFALLLGRFHPPSPVPPGVSARAFVAGGVTLAEEVSVQPFAVLSEGVSVGRGTAVFPGVFLGRGVTVGEDCVLYPGVALMEGTRVGDRVVIHAGTVVGADGFGYLERGGRHVKVPQVGGVLIEEDVEVGANVTIDRATTGNTVIGRGTKIDNLVQVAHNVRVGEHSILVAQSGVAGSSSLGGHVVLGGQAAVADHVRVQDGVMLAARAAVMSDTPRGVYGGAPAIPHRDWLRAVSLFNKLPEMHRRVLELERKIQLLEGSEEGEDDEHQ
ncbi:MAG: UDP-3-O-(3-hydroxymyristoyl)glucosamine N-acyltransferase [Nitrospirota bacterium]